MRQIFQNGNLFTNIFNYHIIDVFGLRSGFLILSGQILLEFLRAYIEMRQR